MSATLTLRPATDEDAEAFYVHQLDQEANAMCASIPRDRTAFFEHWRRTSADPANVRRTIVKDGTPAGYLGRFQRFGKTEICYWIDRAHWGKGVATEALRLFLREWTERPLHARVAKRNPASLKVLKKCGFAIVAEETYESRGEKIEEYLLRLD